MLTSLSALVRGTLLVLIAGCGLAVGVARLTPKPSGFRLWQTARHAAINGGFFAPPRSDMTVFETDTGRVVPLALPDGDALEWAGFSDWVDDDGECQVVGRWTSRTGAEAERTVEAVGLARFRFPSGLPLNRVCLDHAPMGPPCWYPQNADRVLYVSGDGGIYSYKFSRKRNGDAGVTEDRAQPVVWRDLPPGASAALIDDLCWPRDPRLGGRVLVSVSFKGRGPRGSFGPHELWWLQLDRNGTAVAAAGRLASDRPHAADQADADLEERHPRVRSSPTGDLVLAYQLRRHHRNSSELRVARLGFDARTEAPVIRHADSHTLLDDCVTVPPVFSAAGDGIFALVRKPRGPAALRRVAFSEGLLPGPCRPRGGRAATPRSLTFRPANADVSGHSG